MNLIEDSVKSAVHNSIGIVKNIVIDRAEQAAEEWVSSQNIEDPAEREDAKNHYKVMYYEGIRELMP